MFIFEKLPRLRIVYLIGCALCPAAAYFSSGSWISVLITLPVFLIDGYVALAKSNVVAFPRAEIINNWGFDLLNVSALVIGAAEIVSYFLRVL